MTTRGHEKHSGGRERARSASFVRRARPAAAALLIGCGTAHDPSDAVDGFRADPILGGMAAARAAWPGVALLDTGCVGVLVHETHLLTAAHCGQPAAAWFGPDFLVSVPEQRHARVEVSPRGAHFKSAIESCHAHPEAGIGSDSDIAVCRLAEPVLGAPLLSPALGCELGSVEPGMEATLVGFGYDRAQEGRAGRKRVATAAIEEVGLELAIGNDTSGTCHGDSGGPALIRIRMGPTSEDFRLLGVLSSGYAGTCGVGFYTEVARHVPWLERQTGADFSPCFSDSGTWQPTARCTTSGLSLDGTPVPDERGARFAASCGAAFDPQTARRLTAVVAPACSTRAPGLGGTSAAGRRLLALAALFSLRKRGRASPE